MDWEDTVIDISYASRDDIVRDIDKLLLAQAETSFKAGYNKSLAQLVNMTEECKQIGRKEVVEWVEENYGWLSGKWLGKDMTLSLAFDRWEAQLKEWGIKEEQ